MEGEPINLDLVTNILLKGPVECGVRHDLVTEQRQQFAFCVLLACNYHPLSTSLLYSTT